jgi:hypothetical protein
LSVALWEGVVENARAIIGVGADGLGRAGRSAGRSTRLRRNAVAMVVVMVVLLARSSTSSSSE